MGDNTTVWIKHQCNPMAASRGGVEKWFETGVCCVFFSLSSTGEGRLVIVKLLSAASLLTRGCHGR